MCQYRSKIQSDTRLSVHILSQIKQEKESRRKNRSYAPGAKFIYTVAFNLPDQYQPASIS